MKPSTKNQLIVDRYLVDGSLLLASKPATKKPATNKPATINHPAFALLLALALLLAVLLFAAVQPASADPGWYNAEWAYRKSITIQAGKVNGDLSNFPVLISFTDTDLRDEAQNDGNDILFTSSDETTKLKHEIEEFDGDSGKLIAWVKVNPLSGSDNTVLYMYYGNSDCVSQQDATNVWDANYKGVWHLLGDDTNSLPSATGANDGTKQSVGHPANILGKIDGAQDFDGTNDYVNLGDFDSNNGSNTFEFWLNPNATSANMDFFPKYTTGGGDGQWNFRLNSGGTLHFWYNPGDVFATSSTIGANWHHVAFVYTWGTGASAKWYIDGEEDTGASWTGGGGNDAWVNSDVNLYMAWGGGDADYFKGVMDEVRVSNVVRSAGWIGTEYNNQYAPGTFSTLGDEVTNWKSYNDVARTLVDDHFISGQYYVYMNGTGFSSSATLNVGYYDNGGVKKQTNTYSGGVPGGLLNKSQFYFPGSGGQSGTWHAVVYQGALPATYAAVSHSDAAYVVEANFQVDEEPLPEFPTVVTAIAVCMLCAVAYGVMRRRAVVR